MRAGQRARQKPCVPSQALFESTPAPRHKCVDSPAIQPNRAHTAPSPRRCARFSYKLAACYARAGFFPTVRRSRCRSVSRRRPAHVFHQQTAAPRPCRRTVAKPSRRAIIAADALPKDRSRRWQGSTQEATATPWRGCRSRRRSGLSAAGSRLRLRWRRR